MGLLIAYNIIKVTQQRYSVNTSERKGGSEVSRPKIIIMTGYYRVSTKAEAQKSSFKNQPAYFRTLLKQGRYKHYRAADKFYCDWGLSGTKLNRPGFKEMLEDAGLDVEIEDKVGIPHPIYPDKTMKQRIYKVSVNPSKKPKFEEIWIKSTSRFARNINAYNILTTLRLAGVYVYFIDLDLSTRNQENLNSIRTKLSEDMSYSEGLSRSRHITQIQYEEENRLVGCPFGYDYHKKTKERLPYYTINPTESIVIQKIFQYCIDGLGAKMTSKTLAAEGHLTKAGKPFGVSTIKKILNNEKYMGLNPSGKYTTGELFEKLESAKIRDDYKDRLAETPNLPAIVSREIWYRAQEAQKSRLVTTDKGDIGLPIPRHPFKDLLVCGICGGHFVYDNNGGRGYFKCSTKRRDGQSVCNCNNLFTYKLNEFIEKLEKEDMFSLISSDFENTIQSLVVLAEGYLDRLTNPTQLEENNAELHELQGQLDTLHLAREKLLDMLMSGQYSESSISSFENRMQETEQQILTLESAIKDLQTPSIEYIEKLNELFNVIFQEFHIYEHKKKVYSKEEILSMLSQIKIYGKTKDNTGGKPPQPVLLPILKTTEKAQGLIKMGFQEFTYKIRNKLPDYEAPQEDSTITSIDKDGLTVPEYLEQYSKETKSKWEMVKTPYLLATPKDFTSDLGFENLSVLEQLEDYVNNLFSTFTQFNAQ